MILEKEIKELNSKKLFYDRTGIPQQAAPQHSLLG